MIQYVTPYFFFRTADGTLIVANYDKIDRRFGALTFVKYASAPTLAAAWNKLPADVRGEQEVKFVELPEARKYIRTQKTYRIVQQQVKIINFREAVAQMCDADARVKAA